jgi:hypothetical protein
VKAARRSRLWEPAFRPRKATAVWKPRCSQSSPQAWQKTGERESWGAGNARGQGGCGRGAVAEGKLRRREGLPDHVALLTQWALVEGCAGELLREGAPIRRRRGQEEGGRVDVQQLAAGGNLVLGVTMGQQANVADTDKAAGEHVQQDAA